MDPSIDFRGITPLNNLLTIHRGVSSIFGATIENNKLTLVKLNDQKSIIWSRTIGHFDGHISQVVAVHEDGYSNLHVVLPFMGTFTQHSDQTFKTLTLAELETVVITLF